MQSLLLRQHDLHARNDLLRCQADQHSEDRDLAQPLLDLERGPLRLLHIILALPQLLDLLLHAASILVREHDELRLQSLFTNPHLFTELLARRLHVVDLLD